MAIQSPEYDEALQLARSEARGWPRVVFPLLVRAARLGDPRAVYALGTWYLHGKRPVVERDLPRGTRMLLRAARAGVPDAQYDIGVSYSRGVGVRESASEAAAWFRKAARNGDVRAQVALARCYDDGDGVRASARWRDFWLERAAVTGFPQARKWLRELRRQSQ
ncbi:MAG: sel1 repeat family protein [Myxococcales bacterium]|nr:sel1 repeat family protein [Myxococcales bacterium]